MNAIPERAYHNYERIQLPRTSTQERGRISDMEAYRLQKIAAQRRRLQQQDAQNTPRRVGEQARRPVQAPQRRQAQAPQRRQPVQSARRPLPQERGAQREVQGERYRIRQTGVQNVVGGRRLTPAYEGMPSSYGRREYAGNAMHREQAYGNVGRYERAGYARPRQVSNYGGYGYAKPRGYERATEIENTAYNGVKPIAVEYESPKRKGVVSTILLIAFVFAILSGLVVRYATISNLNYQNTQIQSQNEALKDELDKVKMENALKEDLGSIQERAAQLGMYYPKDDQLEYLEPDAADASDATDGAAQQTVQQPEAQQAQDDKTAQSGAFDGISGFFADLMKTVGEWFGK